MENTSVKQLVAALRSWRRQPQLRVPTDPANIEAVTIRYLMYVLLPAWFIPGITDWIMHRRTRIEDTSGTGESLIHTLMMGEIATPVTLTLLCEVNPFLLALIIATTGVHEATAIWDVRAAVDHGREIRPAEQHIHSFLEALPFMAASALACLHWDQAVGALRDPVNRSHWRLRLRRHRLPTEYLALIQAAIIVFVALPYGEELLRCIQARRRHPDAA